MLRPAEDSEDDVVESLYGSGGYFGVLEFQYNDNAIRDDGMERAIKHAATVKREPWGNGWYRATITSPGGYNHAFFQSNDHSGALTPDRRLVGYRSLAPIQFRYYLTNNLSAHFSLTDDVAPARWNSYVGKSAEIYDWLKTPPAKRNSRREIAF